MCFKHVHFISEIVPKKIMSDKGPKEIENFAYQFGEHCTEFNTHIHFKQFVQDLIKDLTSDFDENQLSQLSAYLDRLAKSRAKEGNDFVLVKKYVKDADSDDDDDENEQNEEESGSDFM